MKQWVQKTLAVVLAMVMVLGYVLIPGNALTAHAEELVISGAGKYDITELENGKVVFTATSEGILELNAPVGANDDCYIEAVLKKGENFDMTNLRFGFCLANINFNIVSDTNNGVRAQMTNWSFYNNYTLTESQLAAFEGDGLRLGAARIDGIYKMYIENNGNMVCVASQEVADKATAEYNLKIRCYKQAAGAEFNGIRWFVGENALPDDVSSSDLVVSGFENFDISQLSSGKVTYTGTKAASLELNAPVAADDDLYVETVLKKGENFDMSNLRIGFKLAGVHFNLISNTSGLALQITNWSFYEKCLFTAEQIAAFEGDGIRIGASRIDGIYHMYIENNGKMECVLTKEITDKATAAFNINIESYATSPNAEFNQLYWSVGENVLPNYVEGANLILSGSENYDVTEIENGKAVYIGTSAAILEFNAPVGADDDVYMETVLRKGADFDMTNLRYGILFDNINFNIISDGRGTALQMTNWSIYQRFNLNEEQIEAFENEGIRIAASRIDGVYSMYIIDDANNLICVATEEIAEKANAEFNLSIRSWPTAKSAEFESISWNIGNDVLPDNLVFNANNYLQESYNHSGSEIKNEAIVAWNTDATYVDVISGTSKPSHFIVQVDSSLSVSAMDGTALDGNLYDIAANIIKTQNAIPVVVIDSQEEATALTAYLKANGLRDIMVMASDASLLSTVLTNTTGALGILDLSAETKAYSTDELATMMRNANSSQTRIIVLSQESADYASVRWLQKRTMTVWAAVTGEDIVETCCVLSNGVDGVVTNSFSGVHDALNTFTGENVMLRLPVLTAHRGYTHGADGSVIPEVTVEALKQGAAYGADLVELDVLTSSDGVLVLHHDNTTDRMMTTVSGDHVSYTIVETPYEILYNNLVYKESFSKDKDGNFVERRIEKLEDVFRAFADNQDIAIYVEFKSVEGTITVDENYQYDPTGTQITMDEYVVREMARLAEKYNVVNQCIATSFDARLVSMVNHYCLGMSIGYVREDLSDNVEIVLLQAESVNGCIQPSALPADEIVRGLYARGATLYTWTKNGNTLDTTFVAGNVQGITTDSINKVQNWVEHISLNDTNIVVNAGQEIDFGADAMTYLGYAVEDAVFTPIVIAGNELLATNSGYMLTEGTATVILRYVAQTDGGETYTLYSNPLTITVDDTVASLAIVDNGDSFGYILTPEDSSAVVIWSSSDENVVKVDVNGNLTYVGAGTATITATCDNLTASKEITVCAVSFDANGHGENPEAVLIRSGNTVTAPEMADSGDYIFKGWYNGSDAFDFNAPITGSVTLTAKWANKNDYYFMDFEDVPAGNYLVQDGNGLWMDPYDKGWSWVDAEKHLVLSGAEGDATIDFWFNNVPNGSTLAFDFAMPTTSAGWDRLAIAIGSSDVNYSWRFEQWQGATSVKYPDWDGNEQVANEAFQIGVWHSVKMYWDGNQVFVKLWEKGTEEPSDYTFITWNSAFAADNKVRLNYVTNAQSYLHLDNIHFYKEQKPVVDAWNITLGDDIGLNFAVNVAPELVNDSAVEITVEGVTETVNLADAVKNEKGQYLISVNLAAAQMTESVQVKTLLNGVVIEDKVYTVRKYAEYILAGNYDADTKALVKEMLNYGAKAQQYFNCNTDDLANSGYEIQPAGQIPSEALSSVKDGSVEGVTYYGASLLYKNKITVRFYFIVDGNIGDYTFSAGDPVMKSNMYYVDIPGINPQDYDKNVTVTVTKGTETLCITYSPMHYITRMYNRETTDGSLKSLLEAMYGYHIVACTYLNSQNWENDDALKILAIGNSFSTDGMAYVYQIAEDLGVKKIKLGNLYIGGCSLNTHYNNISNNNAAYTYYVNEDGNWVTNENYTIQAALESENWDYITLQQASGYSGDEASYSNLNSLIAEVKEICPSAKLVWHMTWAYQSDSTHADFAKYNNDQTTMYQAILSAVQSKVVTNEDIITIIPSGTAIQNARTSYIGDTLTRDGYHLSYDLGRYIAGITWVEALTGLDASNLTYCPDGTSKEMMALAIESAHSATENPFAVTNNRTLESSFIELDLDYQLGYYNSNYDSYDLLASSDKTPYYATQLFTKEDLPVGTVIVYTGSYEYRPEGWVNGEGVGRPGSTKTQYVVIDDAWWGKFTERGFNVKVASISVSEEEIAEVFKIYVPKSAY